MFQPSCSSLTLIWLRVSLRLLLHLSDFVLPPEPVCFPAACCCYSDLTVPHSKWLKLLITKWQKKHTTGKCNHSIWRLCVLWMLLYRSIVKSGCYASWPIGEIWTLTVHAQLQRYQRFNSEPSKDRLQLLSYPLDNHHRHSGVSPWAFAKAFYSVHFNNTLQRRFLPSVAPCCLCNRIAWKCIFEEVNRECFFNVFLNI